MKVLFNHLKKYGKEAVLGPLFKLIEALLELFVPLVVADIIDKGIGGGDKSYICSHGLLMVALGIVGFIFAITAQYFAAKASVGVAADLRCSLYGKISASSYTDLDKMGTSTLITRMTGDINQVQTGVNIALRLLLRSPFIVLGAVIMAFTVDVKAGLVFAAVLPVLCIIVGLIMRFTVPVYKDAQKSLDGLSLATREALKGVRVIRAFRKEEDEVEAFNKENDRLYKFQLFAGKVSALTNPLTYICINAAVIAIIYVGGKQVYAGVLTSGAIIALYNYMSQILVELIKFANLIMTLNRSVASALRIEAVLNSESFCENKTESGILTTEGLAVEFCDASFKYEGAGDDSITHISLGVKKGEHIGIIGATGSGKSTLVSLIPHLYGTTGGAVFVNGRDVKEYDNAELRKMIGIVPQKSVLFKGSVRENLLLGGKSATDDELLMALETAQATETVDSKGGLSGLIEQNGRNLSGGQRQRLCIARALVGDPEILIFDDSTSALDFATEAALRSAVANLSYSPTVFTVSQRVSSVMGCDKIIVLDDGVAVSVGTHSELLRTCPVYADICAAQLDGEDM